MEKRTVQKECTWTLNGQVIDKEVWRYPLCKFPNRDCDSSFRIGVGEEVVCDVYGGDSCPFVDNIRYTCSRCGDTRVGELWYGEKDCALNELDPVTGGLGGCGDLHDWVLVE